MQDFTLVKLAREIAIDHLNADAIQTLYNISPEEWDVIRRTPRFQLLLEQEITAWKSATNTAERTKLKAGAIMEQWLPEANTRLHDPNETLSSKTELAKLVSRISGLDKIEQINGSGGSGFSVTINLGVSGERPLVFDALPSGVRTIEGEAHARDNV